MSAIYDHDNFEGCSWLRDFYNLYTKLDYMIADLRFVVQNEDDYEKAIDIANSIVEEEIKITNNCGLYAIEAYSILSVVSMCHNQYKKAEHYSQESLDCVKNHFGTGTLYHAYALMNLGDVYLYSEKYDAAIDHYEQAMEIAGAYYVDDDVHIARLHARLAQALLIQHQGNNEIWKPYYDQAIAMYSDILGKRDSKVFWLRTIFMGIFKMLGHLDKVEEMNRIYDEAFWEVLDPEGKERRRVLEEQNK